MLIRFSTLAFIIHAITLSFLVPKLNAQDCAADAWDSEFVRPGSIVPHVILANNGKVYVAGGGGSQSPSAVTYDLQIGEGANFDVLASDISGITGDSQQIFGLAENSNFSWRVRQTIDSQPGAWSPRETLVTTDALVCCGSYTSGQTGNTNCDIDGKRNLADITKLIDRVFLSKTILCC